MMAPVAFYKNIYKKILISKKNKIFFLKSLITFKFALKTNNMKNKSLLNK